MLPGLPYEIKARQPLGQALLLSEKLDAKPGEVIDFGDINVQSNKAPTPTRSVKPAD